MKKNLTDITLVVDRSGSMNAMRSDAEGGINAFINEQSAEEGDAVVTLVQFDTEYDFVERGTPIEEVSSYSLHPRGATALLDAVGRAIHETSERIEKTDEAERPGLVVFVVMTDGHENSSVEFTRSQVRELIEKRQGEDDWHFTFLGANQDAFAEAGGIGMGAAGTANVNINKVYNAYHHTSSKLSRMRGQRRRDETVSNAYTDAEREDMAS